MKTLTNSTVNLIKGNQRIIGRLMTLFNRSSFTINRWIEDKDVRLTTHGALDVIREETGLTNSQMLETVETAA